MQVNLLKELSKHLATGTLSRVILITGVYLFELITVYVAFYFVMFKSGSV